MRTKGLIFFFCLEGTCPQNKTKRLQEVLLLEAFTSGGRKVNKCDKWSISFLLLEAEVCDKVIRKRALHFILEWDQCPKLPKKTFFPILITKISKKSLLRPIKIYYLQQQPKNLRFYHPTHFFRLYESDSSYVMYLFRKKIITINHLDWPEIRTNLRNKTVQTPYISVKRVEVFQGYSVAGATLSQSKSKLQHKFSVEKYMPIMNIGCYQKSYLEMDCTDM